MEFTQQRKNDIFASNLLCASLACAIVGRIVRVLVFHQPEPMLGHKPSLVWAVAVAVVLMFGHYYAIRLGKRWAKILFAVFFVLGIVSLLIQHDSVLHKLKDDLFYVIDSLVGWACHIGAMVLLFKRPRLQVD